MQICLTSSNQEQQKIDFTTALYHNLTVMLSGRRITIDFLTGEVHDHTVESQGTIATIDMVDKFKQHQEREDLSEHTIKTYRSVLVALADFAPIWPPMPEAIDNFLDSYRDRECSKVTLAEYWSRINTWLNWAW